MLTGSRRVDDALSVHRMAINKVDKNEITGYLSTPKDMPTR